MIKIILTSALFFLLTGVMAQNVGINNTDPKAALDLNGGLRTRVLTLSVTGTAVTIPANKSFIWFEGAPAASFNITIDASYTDGSRLVVYNGTTKEGYIPGSETVSPGKITELIFLDGEWRSIGSNNTVNQWSLTGNSGTDTAFNFIGTTDNKPIRFKINNIPAGLIDVNSVSIGYQSGTLNTLNNIAIGKNSLQKNKAGSNVAIGNSALQNDTTGSSNIAIGNNAMLLRSAGNANIGIGSSALQKNKSSFNIALGTFALNNDTTGSFNIAIGYQSMSLRTQGSNNLGIGRASLVTNNSDYNVAIGNQALTSDTSGTGNTAIGYASMQLRKQGSNNVAVGYSSLFKNKASENIAIGASAMYSDTIGLQNISVGSLSLASSANSNGTVAIGYKAVFSDTAANGIVAIGRSALYNNNNKTGNLAIGDSALFNNGGIGADASQFYSVNNLAIGSKSLKSNTLGNDNTAIGANALASNINGFNNVAIGANSLSKTISSYGNIGIMGLSTLTNGNGNIAVSGSNTLTAGNRNIAVAGLGLLTTGDNNIGIGSKSSVLMGTANKNIIIGSTNSGVGAVGISEVHNNLIIGNSDNNFRLGGNGNVLLGNEIIGSTITITPNYRNAIENVAVGDSAFYKNIDGARNVVIGAKAGFENVYGNANVFLGFSSGNKAKSSNKLYIENSNTDSLNALIYGDFAADSLLLNAKTVVRNNAVVKGFTKLGGYGADVPSIKTKKITGTGPAVNGNLAVLHGLDASKIISVQIFMQYGAAPTPTKVLPPGYTLIAGYEYQFEIDGANILITNKGLNSANIGNKPFRMLITYEE